MAPVPHLEHAFRREHVLLVPEQCDVQSLLVLEVVQLPLLVVDERTRVGQPKLLRVGFGSVERGVSHCLIIPVGLRARENPHMTSALRGVFIYEGEERAKKRTNSSDFILRM